MGFTPRNMGMKVGRDEGYEISKSVSAEQFPSVSQFTVKDSGARQEFSSGMVRDTAEGNVDFTAILDGPMFDRWAAHLTKAKEKYPDVAPGVANWTLASGMEEMIRFRKSAFRHFRQWLRGDTDEDHAAAVMFNMNGYEYVKEKLARDAERLLQEIPF